MSFTPPHSRRYWLLFLLLLPAGWLAAAGDAGAETGQITHKMMLLAFQLGIIILAAKCGGMLSTRMKLPSVVGEIGIGIIIGPYILGSFALPGFAEGIFPVASQTMPISTELYGFATIASIILLFFAGLETDLNLFLRFSLAGSVVGLGGAIGSFTVGSFVGMIMLDAPFMDPRCLFLGVLTTATSVGISVRILSEHRKMDSPEGVTILAAAVIDDVLGIIMLAVVMGIVNVMGPEGGPVDWGPIGQKALKAVGVWLGGTVVGLLLARPLSRVLKLFRDPGNVALMSLGLALILAGVFEQAGLAMIIGAYVMGLSLSKTDLSYVIQDRIGMLHRFFVPIFFTVTGMMVNLGELASLDILIFGLIYAGASILIKLISCGVPALFLNFRAIGALRVGLGMVPRGEVVMIMAGIGVAAGILDPALFGVVVFMTLAAAVSAPPLLSASLRHGGRGTRRDVVRDNVVDTQFDFPSEELTELVTTKVINYFRHEGFYINAIESDNRIYQVRKDRVFISLHCYPQALRFNALQQDIAFIKTMMYESLLELNETVNTMKDIAKPEALRQELSEEAGRSTIDLAKLFSPASVTLHLRSTSKDDVLAEMLDILMENGMVKDRDAALSALRKREEQMSTGMQNGIALPHAKTAAVDRLCVAMGLKREGIDFQSLDGKPSTIFICVLSPKDITGPHVQFLATISSLLNTEEARQRLLEVNSRQELYHFLVNRSRQRT